MLLQQTLPATLPSDAGNTTIIRCLAYKKPAGDVWEESQPCWFSTMERALNVGCHQLLGPGRLMFSYPLVGAERDSSRKTFDARILVRIRRISEHQGSDLFQMERL